MAGFSIADRAWYREPEGLMHPDDLTVVAAHIQRVLGGERDVCVFRVITRAGTVHWFGILTRPVWDEGGQRVARVYGLVQDHSACTEAEALPLGRDVGMKGGVPSHLICQRVIY